MTLQGKGFYIWQIKNCEGGNSEAIAARAQAANLTHLLLKIADTTFAFGYDRFNNDITAPLADALRNRGIQIWGWHYVKGNDPGGEARIAVQRTQQLRLDGYVIDAEVEYKAPGKAAAARTFMNELRAGLPNLPVGLSSFRYPSFHKEVPWREFLERCDFNMPQVYWEQAHNPDVQLARSVSEFTDTSLVGFVRPVVPTGSAYGTGGWRATPDDLRVFFQKAQELGLDAANAYSWDWAASPGNTDLWDAVAQVNWTVETSQMPGRDIVGDYFTALNAKDLDALIALYQPNAAHVTARRTLVGTEAIRDYYGDLLTNRLPDAAFTVLDSTGQDPTRIFTWSALSNAGNVIDGNDTLGLRDGLIQYHYTRFTIA
ncbi:MAG TPA: nuclear transport factor 2 family protein [Anaerolineales bacterium]|nr:nuclear transport factor 2 family protein [Anaerolineales bacterium]